MSDYLEIHPKNPDGRSIRKIAESLRNGGVVVYPTDSTYAVGCHLGDKSALERIRRLRGLSDKHNFTLMCSDLSELAVYAQVNNSAFRLLKALTPGPFTFILKASPEVPKRLMHPKRKTIGLRVPDNAIALAILAEMGEPLMTTSLILPDAEGPLLDPYEMRALIGKHVDLIVDGGSCSEIPTTMLDLTEGVPSLMREGGGDASEFLA
ncbi:L-threonylcarbamoyladenylate synthase [Gammaproteobacteria bacterium]|nr:L-threonylcarbamoyladenylate synthase [Gammaproteobacteria bacterium]